MSSGSGVEPKAGDLVGFVMGKPQFGDAQLFPNGNAISFIGQIAMMR